MRFSEVYEKGEMSEKAREEIYNSYKKQQTKEYLFATSQKDELIAATHHMKNFLYMTFEPMIIRAEALGGKAKEYAIQTKENLKEW